MPDSCINPNVAIDNNPDGKPVVDDTTSDASAWLIFGALGLIVTVILIVLLR